VSLAGSLLHDEQVVVTVGEDITSGSRIEEIDPLRLSLHHQEVHHLAQHCVVLE
jgi:hypothetical protein